MSRERFFILLSHARMLKRQISRTEEMCTLCKIYIYCTKSNHLLSPLITAKKQSWRGSNFNGFASTAKSNLLLVASKVRNRLFIRATFLRLSRPQNQPFKRIFCVLILSINYITMPRMVISVFRVFATKLLKLRRNCDEIL